MYWKKYEEKKVLFNMFVNCPSHVILRLYMTMKKQKCTPPLDKRSRASIQIEVDAWWNKTNKKSYEKGVLSVGQAGEHIALRSRSHEFHKEPFSK